MRGVGEPGRPPPQPDHQRQRSDEKRCGRAQIHRTNEVWPTCDRSRRTGEKDRQCRGDPKAITKDDWAACQKAIRDQYAYLRNFAKQAQARAYLVETGKGDFFSEKYMAIGRAHV